MMHGDFSYISFQSSRRERNILFSSFCTTENHTRFLFRPSLLESRYQGLTNILREEEEFSFEITFFSFCFCIFPLIEGDAVDMLDKHFFGVVSE